MVNDQMVNVYGGLSSVGRASDCGSECRGFEPHSPPPDILRDVFFLGAKNVSSGLLRSNSLSATTDNKNDCALTTANGIPFKLAKRLPAPSSSYLLDQR